MGPWKQLSLQVPEQDLIEHLAYAPDGSYFVSVTGKGQVYKWNRTNLDGQNDYVPQKIETKMGVSKSIISPDGTFIFFKKDQNKGFLFHVSSESLQKQYRNVVTIAPGNRFIALKNGVLNNYSIELEKLNYSDPKIIKYCLNSKRRKYFFVGNHDSYYSQSLDNNHLFHAYLLCLQQRLEVYRVYGS